VNVGTTKNTDNNSSYDNNNEEPEHLHDITTSTKSTRIVKMENASPLEEKFRQEIDALMEEDIAFLMKFTSSWAGVLGGEQPTSTPSLL
jgi:hypothetical protein